MHSEGLDVLDEDEIEAAMHDSGRLIVEGPLNAAYDVNIRGRRYFLRKRVVVDPNYGQQFAAERRAAGLVRADLNIPRLVQVVADRLGEERYAVFEFIAGREPDWRDPANLDALAKVLASIHSVGGRMVGDITSDLQDIPLGTFIPELLLAEAERLRNNAVLADQLAGFARSITVFDQETPCLCHGDIHRGNFLTSPDGRFWTLDWEACRFRAAAADFNQLRVDWLDDDQEALLLTAYCAVTGRDEGRLRVQIRVLRILWYMRTYNFRVNILRHQAKDQLHLLDEARSLLQR